MITTNVMTATEYSDTELVSRSLAGDRDAFGGIVSRYQTLICAMAYSAMGSLGQSEDLSQETFITAWLQLAKLAEPKKLRSWLCGIARNLINDYFRRQGREPAHLAESLETVHESPSLEAQPTEEAIGREEEAILWRSIGRIPELYREPLVLFYREHQSVEQVATALELSEDAVKQRLSRGRKFLQDEVLAFVEGALERTNPTKAFTIAVVAALPALTMSAKAATLGTAAAKGGASAKAAATAGILGAILSPGLIFFGNYIGYRATLDGAHTDEERGHIQALFHRIFKFVLAIFAVVAVPTIWACRGQENHLLLGSMLFVELVVLYVVVAAILVLRTLGVRRRYLGGLLAQEHAGGLPKAAWEYRSRLSFLGLPLVHIRLDDQFDLLRGPVKGWIAIGGNCAVGGLFAFGGLAIAPVSLGGIAIGLIPLGGIAIGLWAVGALSVGALAYGGVALGYWALGGFAIAWNIAEGGVTVAHDFAQGALAHATQANNEIVAQIIQSNAWFRFAHFLNEHSLLVNLLWIAPLIIQWRVKARITARIKRGN